jgi:hypothetical protein
MKKQESVFEGYWKAPTKNKIAVIVLIITCPVTFAGDLFLWISNKLYDLDSFILRWMEFWTGLR